VSGRPSDAGRAFARRRVRGGLGIDGYTESQEYRCSDKDGTCAKSVRQDNLPYYRKRIDKFAQGSGYRSITIFTLDELYSEPGSTPIFWLPLSLT
jgi:hypothetical protein